MNGIGWAVKEMWDGNKVCRSGWNGKGMHLFLVQAWAYDVNGAADDNRSRQPFVAMKTAQGAIVPWLCSQTDLLAADWIEASA